VRYWSGWALILALALGGPAAGQPAEPILRIETGGHVAAVGDAATDAAGRLLVTVSSDKTARIWSLPDLRPIGVIRPRIAENEVGQLNAVAVSPDGRLAAVGGWLGQQARDGVLLVDIETRQVVRQLSGLPDTVAALAFSSDGRRLAAGFGTSGIRLFRVSDGRQVSEDRDYRGQVLGLDFAPDGRLAAAAADGDLRLYDVAGRRARQMRLEAGQRPRRIRFSPDGRLIAVGSASSLAVEVRDGMTLALRARPDLGGLPRKDGPVDLNMPNVAWSADGRTLYAGGALFGERPPLFAWGEAGAGPRRVVDPGTINPISQILGLRDGGLVFASVYGEMVTLDRDGIRQAEVGQSTGDLANLPGNWHLPARRLGVSPDGRIVEWVFFDGRNAWLRFDAASHEFTAGAPPLDGLFDWTPEAAGLFLTGWDYGERPALNRQGLRLDRGDRSYSAAVAPERVLLGTEWSLLMFDGDGRRLWARPVPDNANRVNQSPDGRLVVAALGDGTIRWYRSRDGEELLALFVTPDAERWVAFTPTGYYAASPGGEDLIGWHLNRGPDQAADFFGAGRFRDRFYRPDVIERVLTTLDIGQALEQADLARGKRTEAAPDLRQDLPPVVTILSPSDGSSLSGGEAAIRYRLRSPSGQPVREIRVLIDGRPAPVMRGLDRESLRQDGGALQEIERQVTVQIPPGRSVTVTLLAEANGRLSEPARLRLTGAVPAAPAAAPPLPMAAAPAVAIPTSPAAPNPLAPRLNAVLVGVSDYADPTLRLGFAAKDARDLAAALAAQRDLGLYREVNLRVLTDRDATRGGVLDALDWLRRQTTSNDVALVFLAGHGMPDEGRTFFLPADGDPERLFSTAVAQTDLQGILSRVPGRVVALVDICHAGSAVLAQNQRGIRTAPDMTAFVNQLREPGSGLIVFAGATSRQPAVELPALGNGAFTAALLEGLGGAADLNRDGAVRTDELNVFVADRVRALTNGRQHPVMQRPGDVPDFPLLAARR
jgi:WD40 repeat protein